MTQSQIHTPSVTLGPNRLRRALDGELPYAVGGLVLLEGGDTVRVLARGGYDFVMVDVQHSSFTGTDFTATVAAAAGTGTAVVARVSPARPDQIEWVLDQGAHGVMVPLVSSRADAETAVAACRYPPVGRRSVGGVRNLLERGPGYLIGADADVVCIIQIEHVDGVDNLDEILEVEGIDAVTPGHVDLARSMGHVADYATGISYSNMPDAVQQALATINQKCRTKGIPVLPVAGSHAEVAEAAAAGTRVLFYSGDYHLLADAVARELPAVHDLLGLGSTHATTSTDGAT